MLTLKSGLKITRAQDPIIVNNIVVCVDGHPGIGKSSLAFTAEKPLCLAFDQGVYRAGKLRGDCVLVGQWSDVGNLTKSDVADYKTIIVDTGGRALDCIAHMLIQDDAKNANRNGGLSLPGFGALKSLFAQWLSGVKYMGLDVVLVCHSDEQRDGDKLITRLDMQGASKNEVYKSADLMGSLTMERGKRVLNFSPSEAAFGKNPGMLPRIDVPDAFAKGSRFEGILGRAIAQTKEALKTLGVAQDEAATLLDTWKAKVSAAASCGDFDALTTEGKALADGADKTNIGRLIAGAAKAKGLTLNKATGLFDLAPHPSDSKGKK